MLRQLCDVNKFISKLRYIGEIVNQNAIKRWNILSGNLHWQLFDKQEELVRIAAAIYNCYLWKHETWPFKRPHDESDFQEMFQSFRKPSLIFPLVFDMSFSARKFDICKFISHCEHIFLSFGKSPATQNEICSNLFP